MSPYRMVFLPLPTLVQHTFSSLRGPWRAMERRKGMGLGTYWLSLVVAVFIVFDAPDVR